MKSATWWWIAATPALWISACAPAMPPGVVDAHSVRCVLIVDDVGKEICATADELTPLVPLILAERKAAQHTKEELAKPGF